MIGKVQLRMNPIAFKAAGSLPDAEVYIEEPDGKVVKCELPRRAGSTRGPVHAAVTQPVRGRGVNPLARTVVDGLAKTFADVPGAVRRG